MKNLIVLLFAITLCSCSSDSKDGTEPIVEDNFIRAADMSYLPLIESEGTVYKNNNISENALTTLKNAGCNTIRVRLWKNPINAHSGFNEVKTFAQRIKQAGMKVWLTVHYSDTWADPANQEKPAEWASLNFTNLKTEVANYTTQIMTEINPDIIQIGNETNDGMLWPEGKITTNESQYVQLVQSAVAAVRSKSSTTKIMLHFAGTSGSDWFFNKVASVDYDYIGLSYYPIWHGKDLNVVKNTINSLSATHNKKVILAETAYPFTLGWNDWTNNIMGLESQLITTYPATPAGQKSYLLAIKNLVKDTTNGIGFCYWGSEWVAFRGNESTNGSSWENQALWDFNFNALPAMEAFSKE
jgi:arabinogalactan endo-1,4-beta-galactosidase